MLVCQFGNHSSTRSALYESLHYQEWLIYLLNSAGVFAYGCCYGGYSHRAALELIDDGKQNLIIDFIETILVDVQCRQGYLCNLSVNHAVALHLCKVAHSAQQCIGYTWRSARASGYLQCCILCYGHS